MIVFSPDGNETAPKQVGKATLWNPPLWGLQRRGAVNKKHMNHPGSKQSPQEKSFGPTLDRESLCLFQSYIRKGPSQVVLVVKNPPPNAGDARSIPGLGRSPGDGHGNPLQYSCLKNPMGRRAWQATVRRVVKGWTRLERLSVHAC